MRISCNFGYLVVLVVLRIDCSDQLSRDEVISLTFSTPLRVNVCYLLLCSSTNLALEWVKQVGMRNVFWLIVQWVHNLLRRKCVLGLFPDVRSRLSWNGCLLPVIFCSGLSSYWPSLEHVQSCKSRWNLLFFVSSRLLNHFFRVYFREEGGVIVSWELLCAGDFLMFLNRVWFVLKSTRVITNRDLTNFSI